MSSKPECRNDWLPDRKLAIVAPASRAGALNALTDAYSANRIRVDLLLYNREAPGEEELEAAAEDKDAVLFIFPGRKAPRTVVRSLFLTGRDRRDTPIGLVPDAGAASLRRFSTAAAAAQLREKEALSVALLAQRHPRYLRLANRMEYILKGNPKGFPLFNWTSDKVFREDMVKGLGGGLGMALYFGHGRPIGWVGYYGLRAHHFGETAHPLGALISLCCLTASRRKTGISFSEKMVLQGNASSALGAVTATLHTQNTRWAVQIGEALREKVHTIGELLAKAKPVHPEALNAYRLLGDPLAPLLAPEEGIDLAKRINIYP